MSHGASHDAPGQGGAYLGKLTEEDGRRKGEALFLAIAFTFSSTVVTVKLLEEKGEFNRVHGRLAVGVLLVQDLAEDLLMQRILLCFSMKYLILV